MENAPIIDTTRHDTTRHDTTRHDTTPIVRLFWTGGWDSTYRLVELSRMSITVEPVYCIDRGRKSLEIERAAMKKILAALQDRPETKAKILPIRQIDINTLPENKDITEAYETICRSVRLGTQYEWLAKAAIDFPGIEISIEKPGKILGGCTSALHNFAKMTQADGMLRIDPELSSKEGWLLFGNMVFPVLDITEPEMLENIKAWGYEDIMSHVFFCLNPMDGIPCGMCHSCEQKIERGMCWLLPPEALARYRRHKKLEAAMNIPVIGFAFRVLRKVKNGLRKILR